MAIGLHSLPQIQMLELKLIFFYKTKLLQSEMFRKGFILSKADCRLITKSLYCHTFLERKPSLKHV